MIAESYEAREFYDKRRYGRAVIEVMKLADVANGFVAEKAPWVIAKQEGRQDRCATTSML